MTREDERMRRTRGHGRIATVADTLWRAVSGLVWASSGFNFVRSPLPSALFAGGNSGGLSIQVAEQLSLLRPGPTLLCTTPSVLSDSCRPDSPFWLPFPVLHPRSPVSRPSTLRQHIQRAQTSPVFNQPTRARWLAHHVKWQTSGERRAETLQAAQQPA